VTAELKKKKTQQAVAQEAVEEHPSLLQLLKGHKYGVTAAAYSPNGRFLATASSDRSIRLYFRETLKSKNPKLHQINIEYDHATAMCFSSDGRSLVVATGSGTVKVYRTLALGSCKDLGMVFDGANMLFAFCCWQRNCGSSRRSWQTSLCRTRRMCTRCS
jgi:WD40 repeat protein